MGLNWVPFQQPNFNVAGRFPGATSVAAVVIDMANNVAIAASTTAMTVSAVDGDFWTYDLALLTGTIGGTDLDEVPAANLLVVMTPTGGTGVEQELIVGLNGVALQQALHALHRGAVYVVGAGGVTTNNLGDGSPGTPIGTMTAAKSMQVKLQGFGINVEVFKVLESGTVFSIEATYSSGPFILTVAAADVPGVLGGVGVHVNSGADVNGCRFLGLQFESSLSDFGDISDDGVICQNCSFVADIAFEGVLIAANCTWSLSTSKIFQGAAKFIQAFFAIDCFFFSATVDHQDNDATSILFRCSGNITLENHTSASEAGLTHFDTMQMILDSTVTDGTHGASGKTVLLDNSTPPNPTVSRFGLLDEAALGQFVLVDQREYEQDGASFLQTKCRRSHFLTAADLAAATPDVTPPFVEGKHTGAIKTQYVESTKSVNPGQPESFTVRTI